ncbi:MAG: tRNA (adenosine(37)-N6)-dimethylallyltransferase MiaA [Parcubacteria group bacterium]
MPLKKNLRPKVVAIVGPTGSGKTALAVKLVQRFGGVVISADSRQLYRDMDIGTAKPTRREQRLAQHYLIDIINPNQRYSAGRFQRETYRLVRQLHQRHPNVPIFIVGGTYLYIDAVLKGLNFAHTKANFRLRAKLERLTLTKLWQRLRRLDPYTAAQIDSHNRRRLVRALEVVLQTGRSFYEQRTSRAPDWDVLILGVRVPQAKLDASNRQRIDKMFRQGWGREVKRLIKKYPRNASGFLAHGYREVIDYLAGQHTLAETKERIAINTRHHTKRQMAWFKKDSRTHWLPPTNIKKASQLVAKFLE